MKELDEWVHVELPEIAISHPTIKASGPGSDVDERRWMILTGGEPGLQLDAEFVKYFREHGDWGLAIETNGTVDVSPLELDWVTVSPKVAEHAIRQLKADEVKYVRGYGQAIPETRVEADHRLISPAFNGMEIDGRSREWCVKLVKENPGWRLSIQQHKAMGVR